MDDIDRTFAKLKKVTFNQVRATIPIPINPVTFTPEYNKWQQVELEELGWTIEEANEELLKLI